MGKESRLGSVTQCNLFNFQCVILCSPRQSAHAMQRNTIYAWIVHCWIMKRVSWNRTALYWASFEVEKFYQKVIMLSESLILLINKIQYTLINYSQKNPLLSATLWDETGNVFTSRDRSFSSHAKTHVCVSGGMKC